MEKQNPPPYDHQFHNQGYAPEAPPQGTGQPGYSQYPPQSYAQPQPVYNQQPPIQPIMVPMAMPVQQQQSSTSTTVVVNSGGVGGIGCPVCHNNSWTGTYDCCAWCCLILFFPIGIICCLCMRKKKCTQCGYTVG